MKREYILIIALFVLITGYIISAGERSKKSNNTVQTDSIKPNPTQLNHVILQSFPDSISFAGEWISLDEPDLAERYDREIILNTHFHSNTIILIKKSHRWFPLFEPVLKKYDIPDDFKYLTLVEGALRNDRSPRDAVGFWQFLPATARELGLEVNNEVDERYNPVRSTEAACKYLLRAKEKFGSWTNAAASYNIGMRGLARNMEKQNMESYYDLLLNEETSRYIFRIMAFKHIFENPKQYGFEIREDLLYTFEPLDSVIITSSISDLTEFAFSRGINYKTLKRHNPWLRKNSLTIKKQNKQYIITIPVSHPSSAQAEVAISDSLMIGVDRIEDPEEN